MQSLAQTGNYLLHLAQDVWADFDTDRCARVAAALSFTTLLALVPLATVLFAMLSLFPVFETWQVWLEDMIFRNFVPASGDAVRTHLRQFSDKAGQLTALGLLFLIASSLLLLFTIEDAFNDIWRVKRGRKLFVRLLVYWATLTLGPVLIAVSLSMSSTMLSLAATQGGVLLDGLTATLARYLPFLLELGAYILFYMAIPNTDVKFRHALTGGVIAAILFELTKLGFGYYIINFPSYEVIYGALASIPIFFIWIYLCWLVMLAGAVITAVLGRRDDRKVEAPVAQETGVVAE